MKIAHIATLDASLHSLLLNQMLSIRAAGYEVVGISSPGAWVGRLEAAGIRHIATPIARRMAPRSDLASLWRLYQVLRRERFTIVHTHNPKPGLLGQLAARMARVPIVINTLHGFYFHANMPPVQRRFYITLERIAARCSDVILSQNREDMNVAIAEGICAPEQIKHLGNGIDLHLFDRARITATAISRQRAELGIPEGAPVVGFVGRLSAKRKGFLDFLAAGRRIAQQLPSVRFLIAGIAAEGEGDAVSPAAAAGYGIAERCHFLGWWPGERMPLLYALMDVLVLPSLYEGIPRAIMEAAAMETPVVATNVKGNREAVIHNRNGLLTPLGDVPALAAAVTTVLGDRERAGRMGAEGRRMAREQFDERLVFQRVKEEYRQQLHRKGMPAPALATALGATSEPI